MSNKPVTSFGQPPIRTPMDKPVFVGAGVDPRVAAHEAALAARQGRSIPNLPRYNEPVGGGLGVSIPRLDAPAEPGMTMAAQAENVNSPPQHRQVAQALQTHGTAPNSIIEPTPFTAGAPSPLTRQPPMLNLVPSDLLPEEAMRDPECRQGTGANYAINQPHLAARYGVMRGGQRVPPQALTQQAQRPPQAPQGHPSSGQRSLPRGDQTLRELNALAEAQKQRLPSGLPQNEQEAEREMAEHSSATSSGAGDPPVEPMTAEQEEKVREAVSKLDSFDYEALRRQIAIDQLRSPEQRKLIEGRLKPLSIDELIMKDRVSQDVPITPGLTIRFRSMTGDDDLALKRLLMLESKNVEVTEAYLHDKFSFMSLTAGLDAINNNPVPGYLDEKGEFNEGMFWKKFNWVMKRPLHLLACIGANHTWFELRVRKLFVATNLGNG